MILCVCVTSYLVTSISLLSLKHSFIQYQVSYENVVLKAKRFIQSVERLILTFKSIQQLVFGDRERRRNMQVRRS
jgi:hypothetical protein